MKRIIVIAVLILAGLYTEAQLVSTKHALWEIRASLQRPVIRQRPPDIRHAVLTLDDDQ
jgi:hypothetical protein